MSSPIARKNHQLSVMHKALNALHRKLSHGRRIDAISAKLITCFKDIVGDRKNIQCLDVGCGDLGIMEKIADGVQGTIWQCLDIYDLPEHLSNNTKWSSYKKFNGRDLPYDDNSIDIILFCDMLHHANNNAPHLLQEARRVGRYVVVKDSLEYSFYSRLMLKVMDFVGNWGYGVPLPRKYFTIDHFTNLCRELDYEIKRLDIGIQIYGHLPIIRNILRPEWHFIAVLDCKQ